MSGHSVRPLWSLLFLAIACGNPTDPQLLPGSYSLMSIDGTPLPLLRRATLDCDFTVTDATLRIGPADSASLNVSENYDCTRSGGQLTIGGRAYPGTFTVAARVLTLVSPTLGGPPVELTGTIVGDGRTIDLDDPADYAAGPGVLRLRR